MDVSVILTIYNGEPWLDECLHSILQQVFTGKIQLSVFNDASTDNTSFVLEKWEKILRDADIDVIISGNNKKTPSGVGYGKNKAIEQSTGEYLCFLDADDVMSPFRIQQQHNATKQLNNKQCIVGSKFHRVPVGSTERYTNWANNISSSQMLTQIYTSHGPTVIMPTWFCSRNTFNKVGRFSENGKGTPEDLIFFYDHLRLGGKLHRVDQDLVMYRYHVGAATFSISEETIWNIRLKEFEENVLSKWSKFTIWNAGKQGRKFYRSLSGHLRSKVVEFCDVDNKKILKGVYIYEDSKEVPRPRVPIVHFTKASTPMVICVKIDLTKGGFESNLESLNLVEGTDYFFFS